MSWNNQGGGGGGPWGGGGGGSGGPRGQWPPSGGGTPPNIEEMLRRSQDKVKRFLPGGFGSGRSIALIVGGIVFLWFLTGFYQVKPDEQGVQLLFGKWDGTTKDSGLHWWPAAPIGEVQKPKVTVINRVNVGFRDAGDLGGRTTRANDVPRESLMLTGDQNIADVDFTVQWLISDAGKYLFNIRDPEDTVKLVAESVMREVVGQTKLDDLITTAREQVQSQSKVLLQEVLDEYGAGIGIERIQLQLTSPPPPVIDAFNDVQRARQDKERLQNEAEAYSNRIVPTARGEAASVIQEATAYKERVIKEAQGEGARFEEIYKSYLISPDVTRRRLYIETLRDVLSKANKIILDEGGQGGQGVIPFLPLNELMRKRSVSEGGQ
ncbi:MAG: FtsH protease activity modulator HflK [Alphaproteobacteria bacterium]|nr:FtsH protease activity modulator HflK [Alphaproteobacteria bacterium]